MDFVLVGKIINTHGVKGELKIESHTDFVKDRFKAGNKLYIGEKYEEVIVKSYRLHQGFILVSFETLEDINLVLKYKGLNLYANSDNLHKLDDGEYYFKDLRDLDVFVNNNHVGKVLRVESGIKYNYLRILVNDKERLVPYLETFIKNVDVENKRIDIVNMEGLL